MSESDSLAENNIRLVHHVLQNTLKIPMSNQNYDDFFQEGCIGLIKAANTYRPDTNWSFSTYACRCIQTSILMYIRKLNKGNKFKFVSIYDESYENCKLEDILTNDECCLYEEMSNESIEKQIIEDYKKMSFNKKEIFDDYLKGLSQHLLANKYRVSQSQISRTLINQKRLLRHHFKEKYNV